VQPYALGRLAYEVERIGKPSGEPEIYNIYSEQESYVGLCKDVWKRDKDNNNRIREAIEANKHIKWTSEQRWLLHRIGHKTRKR